MTACNEDVVQATEGCTIEFVFVNNELTRTVGNFGFRPQLTISFPSAVFPTAAGSCFQEFPGEKEAFVSYLLPPENQKPKWVDPSGDVQIKSELQEEC